MTSTLELLDAWERENARRTLDATLESLVRGVEEAIELALHLADCADEGCDQCAQARDVIRWYRDGNDGIQLRALTVVGDDLRDAVDAVAGDRL